MRPPRAEINGLARGWPHATRHSVGAALMARMGGRAVECTGLEIRQSRKRFVGSNPTPSARLDLGRSGVARSEPDSRYPVALAPGQAQALVLFFEAHRITHEKGAVDSPKRIYADDGVGCSVDLAGDHRHHSALRTDVEQRGSRSEGIVRHAGRISHRDSEITGRAGSPHATMLGAEGARAGACGNRRRVGAPIELERDIPAMAASRYEHTTPPLVTHDARR